MGGEAAIATRFAIDTLYGAEGVEALGDGQKFIELVDKEGLVDLWDLNIGDIAEWGEDAGPSRFYKAGHQRNWTDAAKRVAKVPVLGVSRETSPDDMAARISEGRLDILGFARPSIADPFIPKKIAEGRYEDIRECIGCNVCISRWEIGGPPMICTQNATANEEYRRGWHPEKFSKTKSTESVLVVGAGPAGMECARVLGERGYDVHLREADAEIGGRIPQSVVQYPGLSEWGRVTTYRQIQLGKLKTVEVHTGIGKMSADDILSYGADKVVLATGSHWAENGDNFVTKGPVEGIDASLPYVCTPEQILLQNKPVGDKVLVVDCDGYFTGVSLAELLTDRGKKVTILTPLGGVAPYTHFTLEAPNLHRMMHEKHIHEMTYHFLEKVEEGKATAYNVWRDGYKRSAWSGAGRASTSQGRGHARGRDARSTPSWWPPRARANDGLWKELYGAQGRVGEERRQGHLSGRRLLRARA